MSRSPTDLPERREMNNIETEKPKGVSSMRRVIDPVGYLLTEAFHCSAFCNLPGDRLGRD